MISKLVIFLLLAIAFADGFYAQPKKATLRSKDERLITAFAHSKTLPSNFGDDGVFVGDLSPDVLRIIRLGKRAIPLLIRHLDDRRVFTRMEFCCEGTSGVQKVTVGNGVLDILVRIIHEAGPMFDRRCLQAKVRPEGNFAGKCLAERFGSGKKGKQNWLRAYRAGKIRYKEYVY